MGKVPTIAIVAVVAVLIIGMSVAAFYLLIKPKKAELEKLRTDLEAEKAVVAQKGQAEADKAAVDAAWLKAQQELAGLRERKSIHISMYMPLLAMTAIWYEYRDELPKAVQKYMESQGVTIESGATIPAPPMTPPTIQEGFMQVPSSAPLNLTVKGTIQQIQNVYKNLAQLPRVATIGALNLSGSGAQLTATFPLSLYIIIEGPAAPPAAAAGGGGPGGPGGGPGGPGGPEGAPGGPGGAPGAGPGAPGDPGGVAPGAGPPSGGPPKGGGKKEDSGE